MKNQRGLTAGIVAKKPGWNRRSSFLGCLACPILFLGLLGATTSNALGQEYDLTNGNSTLSVNASSPSVGMFNYTVDGVNQANNQWFYYRAGSMTSELSIDTIGALTSSTSTDYRTLSLTYTGAQYTARVVYTLNGTTPGSGQSGLNESITFQNTSASPLTLSFFDYANFRLGGVAAGQSLHFNPSTIPPPTHYSTFVQTAGPITLTGGVTSGVNPTHVEAATYNQTLSSLNDNSATTLNDNAGPVSGDVTGTFEWDTTLAANHSLTISEVFNIATVPEPATNALFAFGLLAGAILFRRGMRSA